jgi:7-cyano-7-deazaguanine reductase
MAFPTATPIEECPMPAYTASHARSGIQARFPAIEIWPNQFQGTVITVEALEFTSVCPKTGLPDFGRITLQYEPRRACLELKSLKLYLMAYRDVGIFYENVVNRILADVVKAARPAWAVVRGEFNIRGGMRAVVEVCHPKSAGRRP